MATTYRNIIPSKLIESVSTAQYTIATSRAIIDKFTAINTDTVERTITVYLVPISGSATSANVITISRPISPNQTISIHEIVGHVIEPGGSIYTAASAASVISIRASGREIT